MTLSPEEYNRYSRHILLEEVGEKGQLALKNAKVLVVGAGGLGCPALQYLTASGVGIIGIIDGDTVQESNLQRQIIYTTSDIGLPKASCAAVRLQKQNPHINFDVYDYPLSTSNVAEIIPKYDLIIDGTDNFAARYLINDACVLWNKPFIHGSLLKFQGQVAVFNFPSSKPNQERSSTYRCVFPIPPLPGSVQNCSDIGVLGVLPGIIGVLQATEAIKIILGIGTPLVDSLLLIDLLTMAFEKIDIERNEETWGMIPRTFEQLQKMDYSFFCGEEEQGVQEITADELLIHLSNNDRIELIDIRNDDEQPSLLSLLPDSTEARKIPLKRLLNYSEAIDKSVMTVIICQTGFRSKNTVRQLQVELGLTNLYSLKGGIVALTQPNIKSS